MTSKHQRDFPFGLGALLAGALSAALSSDSDIQFIPLELDGEGSIEDQIGRAMEAAATEHRKTCADCQKMYAEMNPAVTTEQFERASKALKQEHQKRLYVQQTRHEAENKELSETIRREIEELHRRFDPASDESNAKEVPDLATYSREAVKERHEHERQALAKTHAEQRAQLEKELEQGEQGFMLFNAGEPIISSFNTDRGVLEEALASLADPALAGAIKLMGIDKDGDYEIRSVTKRTEAFGRFGQ